VLPGRSQRDVGIQGREQLAAGPDHFPPQREPGRIAVCLQVLDMHPDEPGQARYRVQRVGLAKPVIPSPYACADARPSRPLRTRLASLALGGSQADIQRHLVGDEHTLSRQRQMRAGGGA